MDRNRGPAYTMTDAMAQVMEEDLFRHLDTVQASPSLPPIGMAPVVTPENAQLLLDGVPPGPLRVQGENGAYEVVDALGNVVAECTDRGYANLFAAAPGLARGVASPWLVPTP